MKIRIQEDGDEVGWYQTDTDEYEYNGESSSIETILDGAESFVQIDDIHIDEGEEDVVGGETWKESEEKEKADQIKKLLEPYSNVEIKKARVEMLIVDDDGIVQKRRIYIDDPSEAPEWADVEEGPQDGLYYETQSSVTDGVPEFLDPSYSEESVSISSSREDRRGRYASSMQRHEMPSGRTVYSKNAEPSHMIGEFMSDSVLEAMGMEAPAVAYDPEEDQVYKEGIEGDTIAQLTGVTDLGVRRSNRDPEDLNEESYAEQVAAMVITGNDDLNSGNMIADEQGDFWIVDHDNLGKRNMSYNPWEAGVIVESAMDYAQSMGMEIDKDMIKEKVKELADELVDEDGEIKDSFVDELSQAGDHQIEDEKNTTQAIQETIQMNALAAHQDELEWTY